MEVFLLYENLVKMPSGGWEKTSPAEKGPKKRKEVEPTEKK